MSIKLVAIDIDGTLINDQRQITPPTVAAINEATKRDVRIVLCTGRPMTGVKAMSTSWTRQFCKRIRYLL